MQYINKLNAVIKSNTSYAVMFAARMERALKGLYQNFGQLYEKEAGFKKDFLKKTSQKYHAVLYDESISEVSENYKEIIAPADIPDVQLDFSPPQQKKSRNEDIEYD